MRYLLALNIYTILAFGASIYLWPFLSPIPLIPPTQGASLYLIHPLFACELFLNLSIVFVWAVTTPLYLYEQQKGGIRFARRITGNSLIFSLMLITIVVGTLGVVVYSEPKYVEEPEKPLGYYLTDLRELSPPNPVRAVYFFGALICEVAWIVNGLNLIRKLPYKSSQEGKMLVASD